MSTRISIPTQSTCCSVNMQAGTKSALPAAGVIDMIAGSQVATAIDGCNACCSCSCTVGRPHTSVSVQLAVHPRPRLPVSSAEQSVLSETGQTVRSPTLIIQIITPVVIWDIKFVLHSVSVFDCLGRITSEIVERIWLKFCARMADLALGGHRQGSRKCTVYMYQFCTDQLVVVSIIIVSFIINEKNLTV